MVWLGAYASGLRVPVSLKDLWENEDPAFLIFVRAVIAETAKLMKEASKT